MWSWTGLRDSAACLIAVTLLSFLCVSCLQDEGQSLPEGTFQFPVAAAVTPADAPEFLFVANSNFDLTFSAGSLQSYDLNALDAALASCDQLDDDDREFCLLIPPVAANLTDCSDGSKLDATALGLRSDVGVFCVEDLLASEVRIGSFADGIAVSPSGRRLYLPVRSDSNVTFVDVSSNGELSCGGTPGTVHTCSSEFRSVDTSIGESRDIDFPTDPVAVIARDLATDFGPPLVGDYLVLAHRNGEVSLLVDSDLSDDQPPQFLHAQDGFGSELVTLALQPSTKIIWSPSKLSQQLSRIGIALANTTISPTMGPEERFAQAFLFDAGPRFVRQVLGGEDTRDIQFDPRPNTQLAYILSRSPNALLIASTAERADFPPDELDVVASVAIGAGPSRLQVAEFDLGDAGTKLLGFATCFDARELHIIDLDLAQGLTTVTGLSGAFELQVDPLRKRLYVIDFRTSVVRVVDLKPLLKCLSGTPTEGEECTPELMGIIGIPQAIEELR